MNYPFGKRILSVPASDMATEIQANYELWQKLYYETCSDASKGARIKWDDSKAESSGCPNGKCTVSEGIGYGMLIFVYMDNPTNNTQAKFDNLWKYYKAFSTDGVMNWIVDGCNQKKDDGGATDAELDVAFALLMAYKQWGNEQYLTDAKKLINSIWSLEVDQAKLLKPGSRFGNPYNPSYFATGVLRIFQEVDPAHDWASVANNCLALAKKCQNSTTGLVPDWCNNGGSSVDYNGSGTNKYGYDAVRTPWRITLDYLWFGTKAAKEFLAPITPWIKKSTPQSSPNYIRAQYNTDGTTSVTDWTDPVTCGSLIIPAMTDSTDSTWLLKRSWVMVNTHPNANNNYFNDSWQIIYELTLAGGFQNFYGKMNSVTPRIHSEKLWEARVDNGSISLTGPGSADVDLVDPSGSIIAHGSGTYSVSLQVPRSGLYFAKISGEATQVIPLMAP